MYGQSYIKNVGEHNSFTPHCFLKFDFLKHFIQLIKKPGYNCSYMFCMLSDKSSIFSLHLHESFGTQNKEFNLEINLHSLKVMETSLFFLLIIWRPRASFKIALAKSVLKQSPKKRNLETTKTILYLIFGVFY